MPRQFRKQKPYIVVFCEGESEQVYTDFLRDKFKDVAVIRRPKATGLFEEAQDRFNKDPKFRNNAAKTMKNLLPEGLPGVEDTDERNEWLCKNCKTFSNVHEAIIYLSGLRI